MANTAEVKVKGLAANSVNETVSETSCSFKVEHAHTKHAHTHPYLPVYSAGRYSQGIFFAHGTELTPEHIPHD